tara:strand:+ start:474 stop:704 length:231 start_codon:yes stop_codon:yes gene_type:complete
VNKWLKGNAIPKVKVRVPNDRFENSIREIGVGHACGWFGHKHDGNLSKEIVNALCEASEINSPFALKDGEYVEIFD